jgi:hypothetical protein
MAASDTRVSQAEPEGRALAALRGARVSAHAYGACAYDITLLRPEARWSSSKRERVFDARNEGNIVLGDRRLAQADGGGEAYRRCVREDCTSGSATTSETGAVVLRVLRIARRRGRGVLLLGGSNSRMRMFGVYRMTRDVPGMRAHLQPRHSGDDRQEPGREKHSEQAVRACSAHACEIGTRAAQGQCGKTTNRGS